MNEPNDKEIIDRYGNSRTYSESEVMKLRKHFEEKIQKLTDALEESTECLEENKDVLKDAHKDQDTLKLETERYKKELEELKEKVPIYLQPYNYYIFSILKQKISDYIAGLIIIALVVGLLVFSFVIFYFFVPTLLLIGYLILLIACLGDETFSRGKRRGIY